MNKTLILSICCSVLCSLITTLLTLNYFRQPPVSNTTPSETSTMTASDPKYKRQLKGKLRTEAKQAAEEVIAGVKASGTVASRIREIFADTAKRQYQSEISRQNGKRATDPSIIFFHADREMEKILSPSQYEAYRKILLEQNIANF